MKPAAKASAGSSASSRRVANRKGEGARLRGELLNAAARVLTEKGPAGLTLRSVAREASVTAPAIYLHFADREELIWELLLLTWEQLATEMMQADLAAAEKGTLAQLEAQLAAYVDYASRNPTHYELLFAVSPEPARLVGAGRAPTRPVYFTLERAVLRCQAAGYQMPMPTGDLPDPSTVLLFVVAHGRLALGMAAQVPPFSDPESTDVFVKDVVRSLIKPPKPKRRR